MTRRDAIHSLGAGLITLAASAEAAPGPLTAKHVTAPDWYWRPMRWFTMNITHADVGQFDPDFWLDYLKRCHVDAASWSSGGIVAYHPTKIPFHQRARGLGDRDLLGYLIEGCRKQGMVVTNRVDHHALPADTFKAHPEWVRRDRRGEPVPHPVMADLYMTCLLGRYNETFMTEVMKEIVSVYRVDGFNHNRWSPSVVCYCEYCKDAFPKFSGMPLPAKEDASDPAWGRYQQWREARLFELWDHWNAEIRKINPNAFVLPGVAGELDRFDMAKVRARAKTLYLDYQGREGVTPPWMAGKRGKELAALLGTNPVGLTFQTGMEEYRWKDASGSAAETKLWVSEGVAHGLRPKFAKFSGTLRDRRYESVLEELYTWQWKHEKYLRNTGHTIAHVGILHSHATHRHYKWSRQVGETADDAARGVYHALVEARIPCDLVNSALLDESEIERFKTLILPNVACLSDKECDQIRAYVKKGGGLIATLQSSLFDETGKRRSDFGLADLFGVQSSGELQGPMKNSYLRVNRERNHALLAGFDGAARIINGVFRVPVRPVATFPIQPFHFVAPYPDLPMEEMFPRDDDRRQPEVFAREVGAAKIVFFPFDIDRTFWEVLNPDLSALIVNAVRWTGGEGPVSVEGPGILDVAAWRQKESMTVHLVNLTNPMMMKGPVREIFPVGAQVVRLRLPAGSKVKRVRLLTADSEPQYAIKGPWIEVKVPSVALHEVVAIDL
jgi:hypothetical protein